MSRTSPRCIGAVDDAQEPLASQFVGGRREQRNGMDAVRCEHGGRRRGQVRQVALGTGEQAHHRQLARRAHGEAPLARTVAERARPAVGAGLQLRRRQRHRKRPRAQ